MRTVYQPEGRAAEYSPLALNLYKGCAHRCTYCFARKMAKMFGTPESEFNVPAQRKGLLSELEKKAAQMKGDRREINLCFMCDPYSTPAGHDITREALEILGKNNLNVSILTKAGTRACRDFDLLAKYGWKFGTTLTCFGQTRKNMETGSASAIDRINAIQAAKRMGIFTWVSVEPVFDVDQALEILKWGKGIVDFWKIGKINYHPEIERSINWKKFVADARAVLGDSNYMFKKDTLRAAEEL
jgi:DNA repair photolyase